MAVATLGALVVVAGILGLISMYLGAVTQATSGVPRSGSLPDYEGRPSGAQTEGGAVPMRYLVLVTEPSGRLASAYLAQLSSSRDEMRLIGLPANLLVGDAMGAQSTLAAQAGQGGAQAVRTVEMLLGVRIDHLIRVELEGLTRIIDVLGGVTVDNRLEVAAEGWHFPAGELRLNRADAEVYLTATKQPLSRLERTQAVTVEIFRGLIGGDALANPAKVEAIGEVLNDCVTVDASLTPGEIRRMAFDLHLDAGSITGTPLPFAGVSELAGEQVVVPDTDSVKTLTAALQGDTLAAWAHTQPAPWRDLTQLPPR